MTGVQTCALPILPLDGGSSLDASLTNFGLLDEELGNISAHFLIYENEVVVDEGLQSVAIASGEQKSITFAPTLAEPGIYRAELRLETSTGVTSTLEFYIGHSAAAIADFESPDARNCAVLLKGSDEAVPALGVPFTLLDSHGIYHILEVETENLPVIVASGAEIVAAVSLDTYGISIGSELAVVDTGDEWPHPHGAIDCDVPRQQGAGRGCLSRRALPLAARGVQGAPQSERGLPAHDREAWKGEIFR